MGEWGRGIVSVAEACAPAGACKTYEICRDVACLDLSNADVYFDVWSESVIMFHIR